MNTFYIPQAETTPGFRLEPEKGEIILWGQACPEDAFDFYEPIINSIKKYIDSKPEKIHFIFNISYYNTASSKIIVALLQLLEKAHNQGINVKITWYYDPDDEDMMIAGEDFNEIIDIDMELKPLKNE